VRHVTGVQTCALPILVVGGSGRTTASRINCTGVCFHGTGRACRPEAGGHDCLGCGALAGACSIRLRDRLDALAYEHDIRSRTGGDPTMSARDRLRSRIERVTTKYPSLRHVTVLFSGTASAQVVVMIVSIFTARIFTPEMFGQFAIYGSLTAIAITVASLRLDMAVVLPEDDDTARRVTGIATVSNAVVAALFSVVALLGQDLIAQFYG